MLSLTCKTAIKAVIYLSCRSAEGEKAGIKEIAENINASEHTISKALQSLSKQGVINSLKGPTGGFYLTADQQDQPVATIVETIDGKSFFTACGLGLEKCSGDHPCPIHYEYKEAKEIIERIFRKKRIKDLCDPVNNGLAYLIS